jgi:hypothetical protein
VKPSSYFTQIFKDVIVVAPSFVPLGEPKLFTTLIEREYSNMGVFVEEMEKNWIRDGYSITMEGWIDIKDQPLINITTCWKHISSSLVIPILKTCGSIGNMVFLRERARITAMSWSLQSYSLKKH